MTSPDWFFVKQLMEIRVEEALREAERERWLREARLHRSGWLSQQHTWLLCQLGRLLVSWGQTLQRRYRAPTLCLEEHTTCGSEQAA